jgi:hypothetical protein
MHKEKESSWKHSNFCLPKLKFNGRSGWQSARHIPKYRIEEKDEKREKRESMKNTVNQSNRSNIWLIPILWGMTKDNKGDKHNKKKMGENFPEHKKIITLQK